MPRRQISQDGEAIQTPQGILCISIDFEMAWGVWDHVTTTDLDLAVQHEGEIVRRLLALFRKYQVPATWAVVAALFDPNANKRNPTAAWHAPELVDEIAADPIDHEVASHSYAHIYYGESSREAVIDDIGRAVKAHRDLGRPAVSLVFPRNQVAHLDAIREAGIEVYRSVDEGVLRWTDERAPRMRSLVNLGEKMLPISSPTVRARRHASGLIELPSSTLLMGRNGLRRAIRPSITRLKMRQSLARAVERREVFHLWFHPSNFYFEPNLQFDALEETLRQAACLRETGRLDVWRMRDFQSVPAA